MRCWLASALCWFLCCSHASLCFVFYKHLHHMPPPTTQIPCNTQAKKPNTRLVLLFLERMQYARGWCVIADQGIVTGTGFRWGVSTKNVLHMLVFEQSWIARFTIKPDHCCTSGTSLTLAATVSASRVLESSDPQSTRLSLWRAFGIKRRLNRLAISAHKWRYAHSCFRETKKSKSRQNMKSSSCRIGENTNGRQRLRNRKKWQRNRRKDQWKETKWSEKEQKQRDKPKTNKKVNITEQRNIKVLGDWLCGFSSGNFVLFFCFFFCTNNNSNNKSCKLPQVNPNYPNTLITFLSSQVPLLNKKSHRFSSSNAPKKGAFCYSY